MSALEPESQFQENHETDAKSAETYATTSCKQELTMRLDEILKLNMLLYLFENLT